MRYLIFDKNSNSWSETAYTLKELLAMNLAPATTHLATEDGTHTMLFADVLNASSTSEEEAAEEEDEEEDEEDEEDEDEPTYEYFFIEWREMKNGRLDIQGFQKQINRFARQGWRCAHMVHSFDVLHSIIGGQPATPVIVACMERTL